MEEITGKGGIEMNNSQEILRKFASSKLRFFSLANGEPVNVKFLYAEEVANEFNGGKTSIIRYHLEVDGEEKLWDRTSRSLAEQMSKIPEGEAITIKRTGQGNKTRYTVERANG